MNNHNTASANLSFGCWICPSLQRALPRVSLLVLLMAPDPLLAQPTHPLESWTVRLEPESDRTLRAVAYANGRWVAAGTHVRTSTDGVSWTDSPASGLELHTIFAATGQTGAFLVASGRMNPSQGAAPVFVLGSDEVMRLQSVVSNTGALPYPELYAGTDGPNGPLLVGASGAVVRAVGAGWERNRGNDQPTGDLHGITAGVIIQPNHASFRYFAVGAGGAIWHSGGGGPTGWVRIPSPTTRDLFGIAFGRGQWVRAGQGSLVWNGRFVAVGAETVLVSDNGLDWSVVPGLQPLLTGITLHAVTYHAGHFVAVGSGGTILHSRDGLAWSGGSAAPDTTLRGVAYNGYTFVAVGDEGLVVQSVPIVGFDRPPRFRWESIPAEFQGRWEMSFMTEARRGYQVQATRDFLTWENVGSKFQGGGLAHVIDLANPFQDRRFYRLAVDE